MSLSEKLATNLSNRKWLASRLRAEIVGPDPAGIELDIRPSGEQKKFSWDEFRKPKKQLNGEEVVWQDPPAKRYGAGVLFPIGVIEEHEQLRAGEDRQEEPAERGLGDPVGLPGPAADLLLRRVAGGREKGADGVHEDAQEGIGSHGDRQHGRTIAAGFSPVKRGF